MNSTLIIGLAFGVGIVFLQFTFVHRFFKEGNNSKSFRNRKFKLTVFELIVFGFYLLVVFLMGSYIIYGGIKLLFLNKIYFLLGVLGIPFTIDFLLFLNHLLNESVQSLTYNEKEKKLIVKRFYKKFEIHLDNEETYLLHYQPPWDKTYTSRDIQIFGAKFNKTVIWNDKFQVSFSNLIRKDYKRISKHLKEENVKIIYNQVNFIF